MKVPVIALGLLASLPKAGAREMLPQNASVCLAPPDFETVMWDEPDMTWKITITRRHFPWTYTDTRSRNRMREVRIVNEVSGLNIRFEDHDGFDLRRSAIFKSPPMWEMLPMLGHQSGSDDQRPSETILGEQCTWSYQIALAADAHAVHECKTRDGIVLRNFIERRSIYGDVAVELRRREVGLTEVLPPELIKNETWELAK